jgi:N6-adenine-specific methylase
MDRVKAAIFSSLGEAIIGARVLDLFAGSGALGIEALSRGAASAIFVEDDRNRQKQSRKISPKRTYKVAFATRMFLIFYVNDRTRRNFKSSFADPPYEKTYRGESHTETLLNKKACHSCWCQTAFFVLEKSQPTLSSQTKLWRVLRQKTYGATEVLFLEPIRN